MAATHQNSNFDVIVLGVGGMGSAACLSLARRGVRVLGLEQFSLAHDRGSSHGESRIIRKAYFEHPDYVPLLHRAYELWTNLQAETGRTLFVPTGLVLSGPSEGETIRGARLSARQYGLELQNFTANDARRRFPGLHFPDGDDVAFEPGAGTLLVDDCVRTQIDAAIEHGATIIGDTPVLDWSSDGEHVHVRTATTEYQASRFVITAGAWSAPLLRGINSSLRVLRKFVGWFPTRSAKYHAATGTPTYYFERREGAFYGFPSFDGATVKVAEHTGGQVVPDPSHVDRACHPQDLERLQKFLRECLPEVDTNAARHAVCLYTMSPDQHFIVDLHPQWHNVSYAAGFSGHGFKFCPVIGEALADLAQDGSTSLPIEFLAQQRGNPVRRHALPE